MNNQKPTPDIIYLIDNLNLALQYPPQYYYYLRGPEIKGTWRVGNTHKAIKIGLHTSLTFGQDLSTLKESDLKDQLRNGSCFSDFDFEDSPVKAVEEAQCFVKDMIALGVPKSGIIPFVSGKKGAGVYLDSRLFGPLASAGHNELAKIWALMAMHLAARYSTLDKTIYSEGKGRMQRALGRQRENGRYRAHIPAERFVELSPQEIIEVSSGPGAQVSYDPNLTVVPELENLYIQFANQVDSERQAKVAGINRQSRSRSNASSAQNHDEFKNQTVSDISSNLEVYPCVDRLINSKSTDLTEQSNFHRMSFLTALQTKNLPPELAQRLAIPLCNSWNSSSMNTPELRERHFRRQQQQTQKKGLNLACHAVRKTLKEMPCMGCPRFDLRANILSQEVAANSSGVSIRRLNAKGEIVESAISNAVPILKERVVIVKNGEYVEESSLRFALYKGSECYDLVLPSSELSKFDLVLERINMVSRGAVHLNRKTWDLFLYFAIQVSKCSKTIKYSELGWFSDNLFVFTNCLVKDGQIEFPKEMPTIGFNQGFTKALGWVQLSKSDLVRVLEAWFPLFLRFSSSDIAIVVLSHAIAPILAGFAGITHRYFLLLIGPSGGGKTTILRASLSLFGDHWDPSSFISATSTPNRLEIEGALFRHLPFPIDDVKAANISSPIQFRRILQNYTDGSSRARLNSRAEIVSTNPIRGAILMTGEDSPAGGESSILGRGLEIHAEGLSKDQSALDSLQDLGLEVSGILPHFIAHLQTARERRDILAMFRTLKGRFNERVQGDENRDRILSSLALNYLSADVFLRWAGSVAPSISEKIEEVLNNHFLFLIELGQKQIASAEELNPGHLFLMSLRSAISSGRAQIIPRYFESDTPVHAATVPIVGYECKDSTEVVYIDKASALAVVRDLLSRTGTSFDFSTKAIGASLARGKFLVNPNEGRTGTRLRTPTKALIDTWRLRSEAIYSLNSAANQLNGVKPSGFSLGGLFEKGE